MAIDVYVVRHEEAEPGHTVPDSHRSLTAYGRRRGRQTGQLLVQRPETIDTIWTSPLVRAVQTAEIMAGALGIDDAVSAAHLLVEPPTLEALVDVIVNCPANTQGLMLVGHQPTLGALIGHLLRQAYVRSIQPGAVVALSVDRHQRSATFRWAIEGITPTLVDKIDA